MPSHSVSHVLMPGPRKPKGEPRLWPLMLQELHPLGGLITSISWQGHEWRWPHCSSPSVSWQVLDRCGGQVWTCKALGCGALQEPLRPWWRLMSPRETAGSGAAVDGTTSAQDGGVGENLDPIPVGRPGSAGL